MCDYCKYDITYCTLYHKQSYTKYNSNFNEFKKVDFLQGYDIKPNYCPICGKKLGE